MVSAVVADADEQKLLVGLKEYRQQTDACLDRLDRLLAVDASAVSERSRRQLNIVIIQVAAVSQIVLGVSRENLGSILLAKSVRTSLDPSLTDLRSASQKKVEPKG